MTKTIISLDLEANGLHGQIFAAAVTCYEAGREVNHWWARCPIDGPVAPWVADHVLPALADMPVTVASYTHLLTEWRLVFDAHDRADTLVIAHIPWPIEARFLWDAHHADEFSGPYPLIDVASMLHQAGEDPRSVDDYLRARGIPLPAGTPHHPLYDCRAAAAVYFALTDDEPRWPARDQTIVDAGGQRLVHGGLVDDELALRMAGDFWRQEVDDATPALAAIAAGEATVTRQPAAASV